MFMCHVDVYPFLTMPRRGVLANAGVESISKDEKRPVKKENKSSNSMSLVLTELVDSKLAPIRKSLNISDAKIREVYIIPKLDVNKNPEDLAIDGGSKLSVMKSEKMSSNAKIVGNTYTVISKRAKPRLEFGNPFAAQLKPLRRPMIETPPPVVLQPNQKEAMVSATKITDANTNYNRLQFYKNKSDLSYVCEKTYPKTKPILQQLVALYAYTKYIKGDPHQISLDPKPKKRNDRRDLLTTSKDVPPTVKCSAMAKVLATSFSYGIPSPTVRFHLYEPNSSLKAFKFDSPYPY
ncbi:uncharacterized protein LOC143912852 [Arctopsyche grandis]|uniref:uncharacterized protein LOC143912852 n=1 Tax=Arctopsyche grandis TaxID=121162 RepID=UPI00406D8CEC